MKWEELRLSNFGLTLQYPTSTPSGQQVRFDDIRLHAQSEDGREVYFEVTRHLNMPAASLYEKERETVINLRQAIVTDLAKTTFAELPAHEYSFTWNGNERKVVLVEHGEWLYRVIYDPRSPINLDIVATIRLA
jgi:hypothetical protein